MATEYKIVITKKEVYAELSYEERQHWKADGSSQFVKDVIKALNELPVSFRVGQLMPAVLKS